VNTVLALIHAKNLTQFKQNMLAIRYQHALSVDYINRTDWFTDLEWIPNAQQLGWIKDVTSNIVDENHQPIAVVAETVIDKPNWYQVKPLKAIHLLAPLPTEHEAAILLAQLRQAGTAFQAQKSQLTYLPLNKLFNPDGSANYDLFNQIPSGSVIVIVRPNWQIRDNFPGFPNGHGTNLNVSHLGIAIRSEQDLLFYHASSTLQKVECEPLVAYLKKFIDSPTIKGIHVEQIVHV
jgi:hypothetical protein